MKKRVATGTQPQTMAPLVSAKLRISWLEMGFDDVARDDIKVRMVTRYVDMAQTLFKDSQYRMTPCCKRREGNIQGAGAKETQDGHLPPGTHLQRHHNADGQHQDGKVDEDVGDAVEHAEGLVGGLHAALDSRIEDEERQSD